MRILLAAILLAAQIVAASAEDFSCSFGRGACLNYGDTVCSSGGKCVSDDAVCFSSFTCGYGGFVCKSAMDTSTTGAAPAMLNYDKAYDEIGQKFVDKKLGDQVISLDLAGKDWALSTPFKHVDADVEAKTIGVMDDIAAKKIDVEK